MSVTRRSRLGAGTAWLLVLVVVGYPVAGLLAAALNLDSLVAAVPLRVAVVALAFRLLLVPPSAPRRRPHWAVDMFAVLYLVRLLWDTAVVGVPGAAAALVFFVATVLIPAAALRLHAGDLDHDLAARLLLRMGGGVCLAALAMHALGIGAERSLTEATGRLWFEALNPISLGHAAVSALIGAMCLAGTRLRGMDCALLLAGSIAALATIALAGSRGPLISLGAAALVYMIASRRWFWILLVAAVATIALMDSDSLVLERLTTIDEDASAFERLLLQQSALSAFASSPVVGSAFVEPEMLTYPHNIFIETAMALGVVGLVVLLLTLARVVKRGIREVSQRRLLVTLLLVQYLVAAQFSGALWGHATLWAALVLLAPYTGRRARPLPEYPVSQAPAGATNELQDQGPGPLART